jgi:hypothetical protein
LPFGALTDQPAQHTRQLLRITRGHERATGLVHEVAPQEKDIHHPHKDGLAQSAA